jgi:hypothetical protein
MFRDARPPASAATPWRAARSDEWHRPPGLSVSRDDDGAALQKYFSYRQSSYGCNVADDRRQRASAAASSVLTRGLRRRSEIPASASASMSDIDRGGSGEQNGLPRRDLMQGRSTRQRLQWPRTGSGSDNVDARPGTYFH